MVAGCRLQVARPNLFCYNDLMDRTQNQTLWLVVIATELVVLLTMLGWTKLSDSLHIAGSSLYAPLRIVDVLPDGTVVHDRSFLVSLYGPLPESRTTTKQIAPRRIPNRAVARPHFIGPYPTDGLTPAQIRLLQRQCRTGLRNCQ